MEEFRPRAVCLFLSHFWPVASGAENQAYAQGVELARRGYSVHVLTREVPGRPSDEMRDGLHLHRWIRPVQMGPAFGLSFVTQGARALLRLKESFDLVHTHQGLWEAVAAGLARKRLGKPVLVQPAAGGYDGEVETLRRTRGTTVLRSLILRNDHFAAISEQIAQELASLGLPPERITRTASGVDTERFSPGPSSLEQQLPPRPRVLFVGRLHPQKNLTTLLHAWQHVVSERSGSVSRQGDTETRRQGDLSQCTRAAERVGSRSPCLPPSSSPALPRSPSLILLGDGPLAGELRGLARELDIEKTVHFQGPVDDVVEYLRAADVFVLPSRAEGSPNALLEAMAVELPCAVSQIGGNVDLIEQEQCGWVVPPNDVQGWSRAILRALQDRPDALEKGRAARRRIVRERSFPRVVDQYEALYRSLFRPRS
jgi:glycosyltransferase involved in cell wall biosynthesis